MVVMQDCCDKEGAKPEAKFSIYPSISIPTLIYEIAVMSKRMRSRVQESEMSFLYRVSGISRRDRVNSSDIWKELREESLEVVLVI